MSTKHYTPGQPPSSERRRRAEAPTFDMTAIGRTLAVLEADPTAARAWDERHVRIAAGVATAEEIRLQDIAADAAKRGRPIPSEARAMPKGPRPAPKPDRETFERARSLGIPAIFAEEVVAGAIRRTPATVALGEIRGGCTMIVLSGERGAGKSFAAAHWLWSRATPARGLHDQTPRAFVPYHRHDDMDREKREFIARAACLVLDDIGAEKDRDAIATTIVRRHGDATPTVITTNMDDDTFEAAYGARVWDRLRECGKFISCGARSLRRPR